LLDLVIIPADHSGFELSSLVWQCFEDYGISKRIMSISTDNASNMSTMVDFLEANFKEMVSQLLSFLGSKL